MSYLIQNFYYPTHTVRATHRSRSVIIARNFGLIYSLFSKSTKAFNILATTYKPTKYIYAFSLTQFNAIAKVVFSKISNLKYTPAGTNFPLSAQYRAISNINNLLTRTKPISICLGLSDNYFKMPYYEGYRIAITPISKKPMTYAVYKFLRLNLSMWSYWPRKYKVTANLTNLHSCWYLLTFLNKDFFKVYNI